MSDEIQRKLLRRIPTVEAAYDTANIHPLGIGGVVDYFTKATDSLLLMQAVRAAIEVEIPYVVVGDLRSVIVRDLGFPGLMIQSSSEALTFDYQRSRVMAETGYSMQRLVTQAASKGFGGLLPFYRYAGTIGGALYSNMRGDDQIPLLSNVVRSLTVLMPPTKTKPESRVVRHDGSWLIGKTGSYLPELRAKHALFAPQPVILTAQFQLTSVRPDELGRRFQQEVQTFRQSYPSPNERVFGPIFKGNLPEGVSNMDEMIRESGATRIKNESYMLDRAYPSFIRVKNRRGQNHHTAEDLLRFTQEIQEKVAHYHNGFVPTLGFTYL